MSDYLEKEGLRGSCPGKFFWGGVKMVHRQMAEE